jgi:hypothetical protein
MRTFVCRHRFLCFLQTSIVATAFYAGALEASDADNRQLSNGQGKKANALKNEGFSGFVSCIDCHSNRARDIDLPMNLTLRRASDDWIRRNEYVIWVKGINQKDFQARDKHGQAFRVLKEERASRMARLLKRDVSRDRQCVACHTGYPLQDLQADETGPLSEAALKDNRDVQFGVTCEGCHGPSAVATKNFPTGWLIPHSIARASSTDPAWRYLSSREKAASDFVDVRTPTNKAKLCLSCHLGDAKAGRVLTHEMYAAGHPPLSGFEIETFSTRMPAHWRPLSAKSDEIKQAYLKLSGDTFYKADLKEPRQYLATKSLAVGSLMALCQSLRLTADLSQGRATSPGGWPELAQYECFACHHDLVDNGWRLRRQPVGSPGRPLLREWPFVLARVMLRVFSPSNATIDAEVKALEASVRSQPFGGEDLGPDARKLADSLEKLALEFQERPLTREEAQQVRQTLCEMAADAKFVLDYDSARQVVWAFQVVDRDLVAENKRKPGDPIFDSLAKIDPDVIVLNLMRRSDPAPTVPAEQPRLNEYDLSRALTPIRTYDPQKLHERFRTIRDLLKRDDQ